MMFWQDLHKICQTTEGIKDWTVGRNAKLWQ